MKKLILVLVVIFVATIAHAVVPVIVNPITGHVRYVFSNSTNFLVVEAMQVRAGAVKELFLMDDSAPEEIYFLEVRVTITAKSSGMPDNPAAPPIFKGNMAKPEFISLLNKITELGGYVLQRRFAWQIKSFGVEPMSDEEFARWLQ